MTERTKRVGSSSALRLAVPLPASPKRGEVMGTAEDIAAVQADAAYRDHEVVSVTYAGDGNGMRIISRRRGSGTTR